VFPPNDGVAWPDPTHLTISFAVDGTLINGTPSNLFQTLNSQEPTAVWQEQVLEAAQAWEAVANVNFGLVADGGQPFGAPGLPQHDPRFGDIRIGAESLGPETLSLAIPTNPSLAGTWTGDIILNSNYNFGPGANGLTAVMMHEIGHALGLGDNTADPNSVMYTYATNPAKQLDANDIAAVQAVYGARPIAPNTSLKTAQLMTASAADGGNNGSLPLLAWGNLGPNTTNYYQVVVPPNYTGSATIELLTSGISFLEPTVTVFGRDGTMLGQSTATSLGGDMATISCPLVVGGAPGWISVQGAGSSIFGLGRYGLAMIFDQANTVPQATINSVLQGPNDSLSQSQVDQLLMNQGQGPPAWNGSGNNTPGTAYGLPTVTGAAAGWYYQAIATPGMTQAPIYASVTAPTSTSNATVTMTVSLQGTNLQAILPTVTVLDQNQQPVPFTVITSDTGTYAIQATNLVPGATYTIGLSGSLANAASVPTLPPSGLGNFLLSVDFRQSTTQPSTFVQGSLGAFTPQQSTTLYVGTSSLFSFDLNASSCSASPGTMVQMTILDQNGNSVFQLTAGVGAPASGTVMLAPGPYTIQFQVIGTGSESTGAPVSFNLQGAVLSDLIGPVVTPPTIKPIYKLPYPSNLYVYPGGVLSPLPFLVIGPGMAPQNSILANAATC
jgi:hypothetical protein